jgi:nitrogen fixation protein NifZ
MDLTDLNPGDVIYSNVDIFNDGGVPDVEAEALIAPSGTRGVLLNVGHVEAEPEQTLYLVRFEDADGNLGPPVGCLPEELRVPSELAD